MQINNSPKLRIKLFCIVVPLSDLFVINPVKRHQNAEVAVRLL